MNTISQGVVDFLPVLVLHFHLTIKPYKETIYILCYLRINVFRITMLFSLFKSCWTFVDAEYNDLANYLPELFHIIIQFPLGICNFQSIEYVLGFQLKTIQCNLRTGVFAIEQGSKEISDSKKCWRQFPF